jgi:hypothetical protein
MVRVYIWAFRGKRDAWGHASMQVRSDYVSWWPMATGRVGSKLSRDIFSAHPRLPRLHDDIRDEGGSPDHTILINGLDEAKIIIWWRKTFPWAESRVGPPAMSWNSLSWNCSKVVATALNEGGGDKFASWSKSWNMVWTPNDVREYADAIVTGMA